MGRGRRRWLEKEGGRRGGGKEEKEGEEVEGEGEREVVGVRSGVGKRRRRDGVAGWWELGKGGVRGG